MCNLLLLLFFTFNLLSLIFGQSQCDPDLYSECGGYIESLGYAETCDTKLTCRDCVGCNQACPFIGSCTTDPSCSLVLYNIKINTNYKLYYIYYLIYSC